MSAANCPETGRQKMIGMMYLFLTAMLAINVSKSILDAFVVVNTSLESTNNTFDGKNTYMYNMLEQAKLKDPKAIPYYDASIQVRKLAVEMDNYILKVRGELINATQSEISVKDGEKFSLEAIDAKDNYDIPTRYFLGESVDGSQGEARKLKEKLIKYKTQLIDLIKDAKIVLPNKDDEISKLGNLGIDTDNPKKKDPDEPSKNFWETSKFDHMPLAAAVTMLSQIQNQVKNAEATIVNKLLSGIGSTDFKFDTLAAKVIPKSNYVIQGGDYEADIFVAAFSKSANPKVFVGQGYDSIKNVLTGKIDSIPVVRGMGKLKIPAGGTGAQKYAAMVEVKNSSTGEVKKYPLVVSGKHYAEYIVAKPTATISPTKMNVLYIGVDNPIDISVSGFADETVSANMFGGGGFLSKNGAGHYIARVKTTSKEGATISVSAKDDEGQSHPMGKMQFRIKNIPKPEASIGGKNGGAISKEQLAAQKFVKADLKDFAFDLQFNVTGFNVSAVIDGFEQEQSSSSSNITPAQLNIIKKVKKNGSVMFTNIKAKGPDGKTNTLNAVVFKVK